MSGPVRAIVLGHTDLGESDRVVRLLTAAHGRVDVVARGARRSRRRFPGALDVGTRLEATWRAGRGALPTLEVADVVGVPRRAREDWGRLLLLGYGCEVLAALSERDLGSDKLFGLAEAWLDTLEGEGAPGRASRIAFEAKALTFAGLTPALTRCPVCAAPLGGAVRFDPEVGGGAHAWCGGGVEADAATLATLERLRRTPLADTPGVHVPAEASWWLAGFIEHHCARPLRSRALLQELSGS